MAGIGSLSPAGTDLGLGAALSQQVKGETEEERRKRMLAQRALSPGAAALLGPSMGLTSGGY